MLETRQNIGEKEGTMGILNYWRLGLLVLVWWCGWAFACLTFVKLMKEYEMEVSIHLFLRSMVIHMFLPTLLVAAICLAGSMLYWHPSWEKDSKLSIKRRTKHLATNIVKWYASVIDMGHNSTSPDFTYAFVVLSRTTVILD